MSLSILATRELAKSAALGGLYELARAMIFCLQVCRVTPKIKAKWLDEKAVAHEEVLEDFVAHVFQHETDHQQGILFVDKVEDPGSYMMADEYRRRILGQEK